MARQVRQALTPAEYLALERGAEVRSEYLDGTVVAMTEASRAHNLLVVNLGREISLQLRGHPCETYTSDMRVRIPAHNVYTYPDVVVACGEPKFEDAEVDTLLNPALIIEVLSDSTERYDRGKKFAYYRSLPSLGEYLLVAQDEYRIDYYRREADGRWLIGDAHGRDATLDLVAGGCTLALADVYERVTLPG